MNKPPVAVLLLSCLFIAVGVGSFVVHLTGFKPHQPFLQELFWISLVNLAAVVAGIFMLRGRNWAAWLALAWMAFHVGLSFFHSRQELLVHCLFFVLIGWLLFRPGSRSYFHKGTRNALKEQAE